MSDARTPGQLRRITANLTPIAWDFLTATAERLGLNQTDTLDRAIRAYGWMTAAAANDAEVIIRHKDGSTENVRFL